MKRLKFKRASRIRVGVNKDYTENRSNLCLRRSLSLSCTKMLSLSGQTLLVSGSRATRSQSCLLLAEAQKPQGHLQGRPGGNGLLTSHAGTGAGWRWPVHHTNFEKSYTVLLKTVDYLSLKSNIVIFPKGITQHL